MNIFYLYSFSFHWLLFLGYIENLSGVTESKIMNVFFFGGNWLPKELHQCKLPPPLWGVPLSYKVSISSTDDRESQPLAEHPHLLLLKSKLFSIKLEAAVTPPSTDLFCLLLNRYLRLSKENIRTLLKLCKDAGMNVDIHPHMVEGDIDAKKVFTGICSVAL